MKTQNFKKVARIRKRVDYQTLTSAGKRYVNQAFVIVYRSNEMLQSRLGITASRKVGNAVIRNKIKRIIRETFRISNEIRLQGLDFNVIARSTCRNMAAEDVRKILKSGFDSIAKKTNGARDTKAGSDID